MRARHRSFCRITIQDARKPARYYRSVDFKTKHKIPDLGVGIGSRAKHYPGLFGDAQVASNPKTTLDWFEVISENFMVGRRPAAPKSRSPRRKLPRRAARRLAVDRRTEPISTRAISRASRRCSHRIDPPWFSDHLCWTGAERRRHPRSLAAAAHERGRRARRRAHSRACRISLARAVRARERVELPHLQSEHDDRVGVRRRDRREGGLRHPLRREQHLRLGASTTDSIRTPTSTRCRRTASCRCTSPVTRTRANTCSTRTRITSATRSGISIAARSRARRRLHARRVGRGHSGARRRRRRSHQSEARARAGAPARSKSSRRSHRGGGSLSHEPIASCNPNLRRLPGKIRRLRSTPSSFAIGAQKMATGNARMTPCEQLDVYREQFFLRHVGSLREDFPTVEHLLGAESFDDNVRRVSRRRSTSLVRAPRRERSRGRILEGGRALW